MEDQVSSLEYEITRIRNEQIAATVSEENTKTPFRFVTKTKLPSTLSNTLFSFNTLFNELKAYLLQEQLDEVGNRLVEIQEMINEFDSKYPQLLLSVDLQRKIDIYKEENAKLISTIWNKNIQINENSLKLSKNDKNIEFISTSYSNLREGAIKSLGPIITKLSADISISSLEIKGNILVWSTKQVQEIKDVFNNVEIFLKYLNLHCPVNLLSSISNRFGSDLCSQITRIALPKLFLIVERPESEDIMDKINHLNSVLLQNKWQKSSELTQFGNNYDSIYSNFRRGQYLSQLRQIFWSSTPINKNSRKKMITAIEEQTDDWEWNENEEEEEEEEEEGELSGKGTIVDLWTQYKSELPITKKSDPFITLYKAIAPQVYANNNLWLFTDTKAFCVHIGDTELSDDLVLFANDHLQIFVEDWQNKLENDILPMLFGDKQQQQLKILMTSIDNIAVETNESGGSELRQTVLSRLVELCAVYVIRTIVENNDIGDEQSQRYASLISKLSPLALYFTDANILVPSWNKLEMLKQLLTSNLVTIREMHQQHLLLDFSKAELKSLLVALFVDSDLRRSVISTVTH